MVHFLVVEDHELPKSTNHVYFNCLPDDCLPDDDDDDDDDDGDGDVFI